MARWRERDETDLRWNSIRRRITRQLDVEIADVREFYLNKLLTTAWDEFSRSLESGQTIAIESEVAHWVKAAMTEAIKAPAHKLDISQP